MGMNEIMSEDKPKAHGKKRKGQVMKKMIKKEGRDSYCVLYNYVNSHST